MTVEQEKCSVFRRGRVGESLPGRFLIDFFTTETQRNPTAWKNLPLWFLEFRDFSVAL
jgi:hypothetical protein